MPFRLPQTLFKDIPDETAGAKNTRGLRRGFKPKVRKIFRVTDVPQTGQVGSKQNKL
jgi:hypothetical protein